MITVIIYLRIYLILFTYPFQIDIRYIRDYEILFSYEYYIMQNFDFPCKIWKEKHKNFVIKMHTENTKI